MTMYEKCYFILQVSKWAGQCTCLIDIRGIRVAIVYKLVNSGIEK